MSLKEADTTAEILLATVFHQAEIPVSPDLPETDEYDRLSAERAHTVATYERSEYDDFAAVVKPVVRVTTYVEGPMLPACLQPGYVVEKPTSGYLTSTDLIGESAKVDLALRIDDPESLLQSALARRDYALAAAVYGHPDYLSSVPDTARYIKDGAKFMVDTADKELATAHIPGISTVHHPR